MPIEFINRQEKGAPLTLLEMDAILDLIKDYANALEALIFVSLHPDGTLRYPGFFSASSTNGTDTYQGTVPGVTVLNDLLGKLLLLKVDVANTGPATFQPNALAVVPIVKFQTQPLESNDLKAGKYAILTYDGTNFLLMSQPGVVQPENYGVDAGLVNALAVAQSGLISIPAALTAGYAIKVKVAVTNTGSSTLTLGALPATAIKRADGTDVIAGDLVATRIYDFVFDGTNFFVPTATSAKTMATATDGTALSGRVNSNWFVSHLLGATPDFVAATLICSIDDSTTTGYIAGDEIGVEAPAMVAGDSQITVCRNSTQVRVAVAAGVFNVMHKTSGALVGLTLANWNLKLRAARF